MSRNLLDGSVIRESGRRTRDSKVPEAPPPQTHHSSFDWSGSSQEIVQEGDEDYLLPKDVGHSSQDEEDGKAHML